MTFRHGNSLEGHSFKMTWKAYEQLLQRDCSVPCEQINLLMTQASAQSMMQSWLCMTCVTSAALMAMRI